MERSLEVLAALNASAPSCGKVLPHPARATVALAMRMGRRLSSLDAGVNLRREEVDGKQLTRGLGVAPSGARTVTHTSGEAKSRG